MADHRGTKVRPPRAIPSSAFNARSKRASNGHALAYCGLLALALRRAGLFVPIFFVFVVGSFALVPFVGRDFFPSVDAGQILMHVRTQVGTRVEDSARQFAEIEKAIRQIIPPDELEALVDNIGMPVSGINMTYNNTGTIGSQDGDIQIKLKEDHRPTVQHILALRDELPGRFPGVTFSFLPADIVSQILNFGAPAPIDLQIRGPNLAGQLRLCPEAAAPAAAHPGARRCAHPAVACQPRLQRRCRPHARAICRS